MYLDYCAMWIRFSVLKHQDTSIFPNMPNRSHYMQIFLSWSIKLSFKCISLDVNQVLTQLWKVVKLCIMAEIFTSIPIQIALAKVHSINKWLTVSILFLQKLECNSISCLYLEILSLVGTISFRHFQTNNWTLWGALTCQRFFHTSLGIKSLWTWSLI